MNLFQNLLIKASHYSVCILFTITLVSMAAPISSMTTHRCTVTKICEFETLGFKKLTKHKKGSVPKMTNVMVEYTTRKKNKSFPLKYTSESSLLN